MDIIDKMDFIELTLHTTKKKVSISISKIEAIFEVDDITRIAVSEGCFDVDESYETVKNMIDEITSVKGVIKNDN